MHVTFLGTGIMGAPMARHLAEAGHDVTAWNRRRTRRDRWRRRARASREDPAAAAAGAEVVVTMLTDGEAVEDVMREAAPAAADGTVWWQASTVGISGTESLAALAEEDGLVFVDAPVLGTKGPAESGELVVLASGPDAAVEKLLPLFDAVGSKTMRLGAAGAGTRFKLVMNHWVLAVTDAIAETISFAEGVDLDPRLFLEAIEGGALDIAYAHLKGPGMIAGDLPVAFPLKHALKDADLILEAAARLDLDLDLAQTVREPLRPRGAGGPRREGHGDGGRGEPAGGRRLTVSGRR